MRTGSQTFSFPVDDVAARVTDPRGGLDVRKSAGRPFTLRATADSPQVTLQNRICFIELGVAARGGIEPPIRGFSVARRRSAPQASPRSGTVIRQALTLPLLNRPVSDRPRSPAGESRQRPCHSIAKGFDSTRRNGIRLPAMIACGCCS
jgi:hypothetical protein